MLLLDHPENNLKGVDEEEGGIPNRNSNKRSPENEEDKGGSREDDGSCGARDEENKAASAKRIGQGRRKKTRKISEL